MGADGVMTQLQAWAAYDQWQTDSRILFLDEPAGIERAFRKLTRQTYPDSKNWADAYLAAFASVSDMRFVTFDQGFEGKIENLLTLTA